MIIGLAGAKNSGKSTVFAAHLIRKYGFKVVAHADPIKRMLLALGLTEEHTEGDLKELPCKELSGATPRWAMQSLGSEWGRTLIHPDIWINLWESEALKYRNIVADGVRFPNELQKIKDLGGVTITIRRPNVEGRDSHNTELLAASLKTDYEIFNEEEDRNKGIDKLDEILSQHLK